MQTRLFSGGTPQNCPSYRTLAFKCHPEEVGASRMHSRKIPVIETERPRGLCTVCEPDPCFTLTICPYGDGGGVTGSQREIENR